EADVVHPQRTRTSVGIAQHRCGDIDGDDLGIRECLRQWHRVVADGAADIEDAARPELRVLFLQPLRQRLAATVVVAAEHAAGGGENATVVIGGRRYVI